MAALLGALPEGILLAGGHFCDRHIKCSGSAVVPATEPSFYISMRLYVFHALVPLIVHPTATDAAAVADLNS